MPTNNKTWEEEFDKEFVDAKTPVALYDWIRTDDMKSFIRKLLLQQKEEITNEFNSCEKCGEEMSHLLVGDESGLKCRGCGNIDMS